MDRQLCTATEVFTGPDKFEYSEHIFNSSYCKSTHSFINTYLCKTFPLLIISYHMAPFCWSPPASLQAAALWEVHLLLFQIQQHKSAAESHSSADSNARLEKSQWCIKVIKPSDALLFLFPLTFPFCLATSLTEVYTLLKDRSTWQAVADCTKVIMHSKTNLDTLSVQHLCQQQCTSALHLLITGD